MWVLQSTGCRGCPRGSEHPLATATASARASMAKTALERETGERYLPERLALRWRGWGAAVENLKSPEGSCWFIATDAPSYEQWSSWLDLGAGLPRAHLPAADSRGDPSSSTGRGRWVGTGLIPCSRARPRSAAPALLLALSALSRAGAVRWSTAVTLAISSS